MTKKLKNKQADVVENETIDENISEVNDEIVDEDIDAVSDETVNDVENMFDSDTTNEDETEKKNELTTELFMNDTFIEPAESVYSVESLQWLIRSVDEDDYDELNEHQVDALRRILEKLAEQDYEYAIRTIGYSYYGGNKLYPCDWEASRDCFLYLMGMEKVADEDKAFYANTLGYIFYYGRCNNGVPEYDKAFKYYTYGAAGQIFESQYKLADMFLHGYGTEKNISGARELLLRVYKESLKRLLDHGHFTKLPDAALRLGNMARHGQLDMGEKYNAYYFYTLADFTIRRRMAIGEFYGDNVVYSAVQKELEQLRAEHPQQKRPECKSERMLLAGKLLSENYSCSFKLKKQKQGLKLKIQRLPLPREFYPKLYLDCQPEQRVCELIDSGVVYAVKVAKLWVKDGKKEFIADGYNLCQHKKGIEYVFTHHDVVVARICAKYYCQRFKEQDKFKGEEHSFASIVFQEGGRAYDYICDGLDLQIGDRVVVPSYSGETEVTVVNVFTRTIEEMPLDNLRYKNVLRKVEMLKN